MMNSKMLARRVDARTEMSGKIRDRFAALQNDLLVSSGRQRVEWVELRNERGLLNSTHRSEDAGQRCCTYSNASFISRCVYRHAASQLP